MNVLKVFDGAVDVDVALISVICIVLVDPVIVVVLAPLSLRRALPSVMLRYLLTK